MQSHLINSRIGCVPKSETSFSFEVSGCPKRNTRNKGAVPLLVSFVSLIFNMMNLNTQRQGGGFGEYRRPTKAIKSSTMKPSAFLILLLLFPACGLFSQLP